VGKVSHPPVTVNNVLHPAPAPNCLQQDELQEVDHDEPLYNIALAHLVQLSILSTEAPNKLQGEPKAKTPELTELPPALAPNLPEPIAPPELLQVEPLYSLVVALVKLPEKT
jgi:hypothetical protein